MPTTDDGTGDFLGDMLAVFTFPAMVNGETVWSVNGDEDIRGLLVATVSNDCLSSQYCASVDEISVVSSAANFRLWTLKHNMSENLKPSMASHHKNTLARVVIQDWLVLAFGPFINLL